MRVEVAYSPAARRVEQVALELPEGSTALQALEASGLLERYPQIDAATQPLGVWGRRCGLQERLHEGDRLEIYRGLSIDPKEARRLRQRKQRAGAGKGPAR